MRALELGGCGFKVQASAQISCPARQCAMASQPVHSPSLRLSTAEFDSYIRGYHVYQVVWTPVVGEMLLLKQDPTNTMDVSAVAVCKEMKSWAMFLSILISQFLRRDCNKGFAEVTGPRVNRGAGYGLEIPCVYKLYGPKPYSY